MCNAQLFEITGAAKGVFTRSQSSCHIAKVVLALTAKSPQRLTRHLATPPAVSSIGGLRTPAPVRAAPSSWGRHPQTFTETEIGPSRSSLIELFRYPLTCLGQQLASRRSST